MSDQQRILTQLRRLAAVGFLRIPSAEGMAEHASALADIEPDLLELAVSRWIAKSTCRFFPFPGELRAMVQDKVTERERNRQDREVEHMRLELIASGIVWPTMPPIGREEARRLLKAPER